MFYQKAKLALEEESMGIRSARTREMDSVYTDFITALRYGSEILTPERRDGCW